MTESGESTKRSRVAAPEAAKRDQPPQSKVDRLVNRAWREARRGATPSREKLAMQIARDVVRQIGEGRLLAGSPLPSEADMAGSYKVGRTSIREALRILEVQGLISIVTGPKGGPTVQDPTTVDTGRMMSLHMTVRGCTFGELAQARLLIDPLLARHAAANATPNSMDRLRDIVELMESIPLGNNAEWARTASMFNSIVAAMSANAVLALLSSTLRAVYAERISHIQYTAKMRGASLASYRSIIDALQAGDGELAEKSSFNLIDRSLRQMQRAHPDILEAAVDWT